MTLRCIARIARWALAAALVLALLSPGIARAHASDRLTDRPVATRAPMPTVPSIDAAVGPVPSPAPTATKALDSTAGDLLKALFGEEGGTTPVNIVLLLTILSVAPSILLLLTGFTRIIIVLGFVRNAMGTQTMPPTQVLVGLALFLTLFVMAPVFDRINEDAYQPLSNGEITTMEAIDRAVEPMTEFMLKQTYKDDLNFFVKTSKIEVESADKVPFRVIVPAFITSELKRSFMIGFMIFIPFIVIDIVVASTLMSMGMMMLPPSMIALPFKIALFLLVDGWQLTIASLIQGFG